VIDDDVDSPKQTASTQGQINKKHRIRKRARNMIGSLQAIREPVDDFARLRELVRSSKKIVVISGAGISASAGCELSSFVTSFINTDFLVPTFEDIRNSKQTSFNRSLYSSSDEITGFYSIVHGMYERLHSDLTEPSPFHKVMDELARTRPYFRHYTQNIDCVERLLPDLDAKTIRLHGRVDQARCGICNWVCDYKPHLFQGSDSLYCQRCLQRSQARTLQGKRSLKVGRLRPNVLLYGEPHPDDKEILETAEHDLRICPELVLIVGTKLAIPGARSIAANFCEPLRAATDGIQKKRRNPQIRTQVRFPEVC
jgi:NAD-dependent SIR2 family protein deacetylase